MAKIKNNLNLFCISQTELKLRNSLLFENIHNVINMKLKIANKIAREKTKIVNIMNESRNMFEEKKFNINDV